MNRYSSTVPIAAGSPMQVDLTPMTDEQCLMTLHYVKCFNIEKKKWGMLDVTKSHEIPWAKRAFDSLVLDQSKKDLVLALNLAVSEEAYFKDLFERRVPFSKDAHSLAEQIWLLRGWCLFWPFARKHYLHFRRELPAGHALIGLH
jgi:hypothetical protein